jgi:hypothetical protein
MSFGILIDYASPSALQSDRERQLLGLSANARRPVRFVAEVETHRLELRLALQALGQLIWSDDTWVPDAFFSRVLDPVITVHPDRVFFEAFSQDRSCYGVVIAERTMFTTTGEVTTGTTNVDFTGWLWAALGEMRSSRRTSFRIESTGFEVATSGGGGRFEKKVDVPESWIRGFLELSASMALPGTRLSLRPVDLLAAIRFLHFTKAKISPRALRYEMEPGADARIVLEPWEQVIPLRGAAHSYQQRRVIRTWGRRRLRLIEPLLPYADTLTVYLKGRAMPSFYVVRLGQVSFVLGLSGWTENRFTEERGLSLLLTDRGTTAEALAAAHAALAAGPTLSVRALAGAIGADEALAARLLFRLARQGRAIYDLERREFRHRELLEEPADEAKLFVEGPRQEAARLLLASPDRVRVRSSEPRERKAKRKLRTPDGVVEREVVLREWVVSGSAGDQDTVELVIGDEGRLLFGTCRCPFFAENLLNQGPCEHLLALQARIEEDEP